MDMENKLGIIAPEIILYNTIKTIFESIKNDYEENDLESTIIYEMFSKDEHGNNLDFEQFNFLNQAVETFIRKDISVNLGYNLEVAPMGSIHILLPSENSENLNIGANEGGYGYIEKDDSEYKPIYSQNWNSNYNILITSENSFEVILIYNCIKYSLLALNSHLELMGLMLSKTSGQELNIQSDLIPTHIFHRSLILNFTYELNISDFIYRKLVKNFVATGIIENIN